MIRLIRRIFRRRYRLPAQVTEFRFHPGRRMVLQHMREATPGGGWR